MLAKTRISRPDEPDAATTPHEVGQAAMGTAMAHKAFGPPAEACLAAVCREVARLEGLLSRFRPDSEISRVNRSAGGPAVRVSLDTFEVLAQAVGCSARLPGCFAVTVGPLVRLWQAAGATGAEPGPSQVAAALALVDDRDLLLDPVEVTARLRRPGQSLDVGGIGKGYAADCIVDLFRRYGVSSACSNLGGNVVAWGPRPDGMPWRVGIQHPRQARLLGVASVMDRAVATSGDYHRYYSDGHGVRRRHILDPSTGYPSASGLVSVTVITRGALVADALSTLIFVAGRERGMGLLRDLDGVEAVLVDEDLRVFVTAGAEECFEPAGNNKVTVLA